MYPYIFAGDSRFGMMKNPNNSKTKQICYPGFTQALLMQHAFGTGLEHERNSRFDQLSQRMCPWSFFWASNLKFFFFSKGISNLSFPPCSTKEIFGTPPKMPDRMRVVAASPNSLPRWWNDHL